SAVASGPCAPGCSMPNVPCDPNWRNIMTQSDPASLRDALLNQARTGNQAVDAGLAHLRQLVEAEQARVRRLTRWTKVVWIGVAATVFLVGIPILLIGLLVGIVLLIMTILARRTAGMHEIRASLASIDAQLRVLALTDPAKQVLPRM